MFGQGVDEVGAAGRGGYGRGGGRQRGREEGEGGQMLVLPWLVTCNDLQGIRQLS